LRQAWGQYEDSSWQAYFLAGQAWTLATPFKKGLDPLGTWQPPTIDHNYMVGYTYLRVPMVRAVKGFDNFWLGLEVNTPQTVFGVSHRALPNYREPTDLIGRRIGVATLGPPSQVLVQRVLARAGMLPGDVQFVDVGSPSEALGYFRAGQIDAISYLEPLISLLEQRSELRLLADTRTLRGTYEAFGGPMPAACFYAPLEFVQRYPETCQALTNAVVRALKWLQTAGPGDLLKAVPERYLLGDRSADVVAEAAARKPR
jgi:ABC-type nitrate/sulfonate/bicarbonate transport system substrate-binding protein